MNLSGKKKPVPLVQTETVISKEQAPNRLRFEMIKPIEGQKDSVVVKRKTVNKKDEIIKFSNLKPLPRVFFIRSVIRRQTEVPRYLLGLIPRGTRKKVDFIVRCNQYWSESLESLEEKVPQFSPELENLLLSDDIKQHIDAVRMIRKFVLDWSIIKIMLLVFGLSIPLALLVDSSSGIIPTQIVVWQP